MPTQGMVVSASAAPGLLPRRAAPGRRVTVSPRAVFDVSAASTMRSSGSRLSIHRARSPRVSGGTPRGRRLTARVSAIGRLFGGGGGASDDDDGKAVFAAKSRRQVRIPGFVFAVSPAVVNGEDADALAALEAAVASGATAVILADDTGDATTRELFNAALALKESLRGRAALLVADRTDIAASAECDGVVLSDDGVPVVVARKSLTSASGVVACGVKDEQAALIAAKEGADLILAPNGRVADAVRGKISVPVFASPRNGWAGVGAPDAIEALVAAGAKGAVLPTPPPSVDVARGIAAALAPIAAAVKKDSDSEPGAAPSASASTTLTPIGTSGTSTMAGKIIDPTTQALLERERVLLDDAVAFLTESTPSLEEIGLLVEARKGLEELFLLVIVGEFNAGKSSVINAMLGQKALKEGILPTTNEITVLKFGDEPRTEQSKDGFYTQLIPADLLREVNIVDTPGTNVILERQQRLTEEFVPRADLVLFVLSADRPMTESEVKFLSYIRKWGKKVAFVVNKCDRLENQGEVDEVKGFVADNAERLLGVTDPAVLPVSAKAALAAKEKGGGETDFAQLEDYILSFLGAGDKKGKNSGEGLRLKLGTPLQVGTMLFGAAEEILAQERAEAVEELQQAEGVDAAMDKYREAMEADFGAQVQAVRTAVMGAVGRCDDLLDATLRLTNGADLFTTYVLGNGANGAIRERYKKEVLGDSETKLRAAIKEHTGWLARNNDNQLRAYADAVRARGFDPSATDLNLFEREERIAAEEDAAIAAVRAEVEAKQTAAAEAEARAAEAKAAEAKARAAAKEAAGDGADDSNDSSKEDSSKEDEDSSSLADSLAGPAPAQTSASSLITRASSDLTSPATVAAGFDHAGAARLLEEEVKDAVYSTVGAAGASFFFAVFLSGFLDNLAEDVLAFSLTAAVGYVSVLSLPLKRAETKAKARAVAESFLDEVEAAMKAEFERKVGATTAQVRATTAPWVASAREAEAAVAASQSRRDRISEEMDQLQRDVQSI